MDNLFLPVLISASVVVIVMSIYGLLEKHKCSLWDKRWLKEITPKAIGAFLLLWIFNLSLVFVLMFILQKSTERRKEKNLIEFEKQIEESNKRFEDVMKEL